MRRYVYLLFLVVFGISCGKSWKHLLDVSPSDPVYRVSPAQKRKAGSPEQGFRYLTEGGYVGSGFPWSFVRKDSSRRDTLLWREGKNALISWQSIAFEAPNGETVVSGSCFSCHATIREGKLSLGLGDINSDFTTVKPWQSSFFPWLVKRKSTEPEWETSQHFVHLLAHSFAWIKTDQVGLNPAFRLEEAFAAHRDSLTLAYQKQAQFGRQGPTIASDIPPLWHVKKKKALYYNGMGRGDFTKLLMQAGMMGIPDTATAREIQRHFIDVVAWLESLEPPAYPGTIDTELAARGEKAFEVHCEKCHGTYGRFESFPNTMVHLSQLGTDPAYALYFLKESGLPGWFNASWFGKSAPQAQMLPSAGYLAPPLDGIWATAPYFHNGSVPTLAAVLAPESRPGVWSRTSSPAYDHEKMGLAVTAGKGGPIIYDTRQFGQGKQGHTYGAELDEATQRALLEYLKTL